MRRGFTLIELMITLVVFGVVAALTSRAAVMHEQLERRTEAVATGARAARQSVAVLARALAGAASPDLAAAQSADTALELMAPVGAGVACRSGGDFTVAAAAPSDGPAFASFESDPRVGDRVLALDAAARPPTWETRTIATLVARGGACGAAGVPPLPATTLRLDSPLRAGADSIVAFRIVRRTRFTLYRGGDGAWYLGMREWDPGIGAFDGVQPVAGPLHARNASADRTGLRFEYFDSSGRAHSLPLDSTAAIASVRITARAVDSTIAAATRVVALQRAP